MADATELPELVLQLPPAETPETKKRVVKKYDKFNLYIRRLITETYPYPNKARTAKEKISSQLIMALDKLVKWLVEHFTAQAEIFAFRLNRSTLFVDDYQSAVNAYMRYTPEHYLSKVGDDATNLKMPPARIKTLIKQSTKFMLGGDVHVYLAKVIELCLIVIIRDLPNLNVNYKGVEKIAQESGCFSVFASETGFKTPNNHGTVPYPRKRRSKPKISKRDEAVADA